MSGTEAAEEALRLVAEEFKQINIFTLSEDIQVLAAKADRPRITFGPATKGMPSLSHDKKKRYLIPDGQPCDFLIRLGVMDQSGKVYKRHYSKFRQINRFLEITDDVFPCLPEDLSLIHICCRHPDGFRIRKRSDRAQSFQYPGQSRWPDLLW